FSFVQYSRNKLISQGKQEIYGTGFHPTVEIVGFPAGFVIKKKNKKTGQLTTYYVIVRSSRVKNKVIQSTILSLGANFTLEKNKWKQLTDRINTILREQNILWETNAEIEALAQSLAEKIRSSRLPIASAEPE
ncbi:MAG: hypothetical protein LBT38_09385, partial [Deltaproteobacteria bacterium]|nr:hypothetical protein [Deltaproteobacteria bacterium]